MPFSLFNTEKIGFLQTNHSQMSRLWKLFTLFGWVYTLWAIYQNANLYFRYIINKLLLSNEIFFSFPSTMQTEQHYHSTLFPKITLCMNSIHSRKRLHNMHISEAGLKFVLLVFDIASKFVNHEKRTIRSYYGYNINKNISYPNITFDNQFFADTRPGLKYFNLENGI